jgi:hypothetical protein
LHDSAIISSSIVQKQFMGEKMALSIGVSVGERIAVGDSIVEVKAIKNPKLMVITVNSGSDISINDNKAHAVEILPGVRLFTGLNKNGSDSSRLVFDAPKSIPIHRIGMEAGQWKPKEGPPVAKQTQNTVGANALFMNGVYEDNLIQILKSQKTHPEQSYYLQPYSTSRILLLAKSTPTHEKPITLYLSLTNSLNLVSYRAKVVSWQDKRKLNDDDLALLNQHIQKFQPSEEEIFLKVQDGKQCVNLISVIEVEKMESPFPTSCLVKTSDGKPLKNRERAGNWVPVRRTPEWLGTTPQAVQEDIDEELARQVSESLKDSSALRLQRLTHAPKMPVAIQVISRAYRRNPDVIAEVLKRAKGKCRKCHSPAPFERVSDGSPYLEVHHKIMLSKGGEDTVANALALCPNCHRKLHFGKSDSPTAI